MSQLLSETTSDEEFLFKLEKKLKFMHDNVEHRGDYLKAELLNLKQHTGGKDQNRLELVASEVRKRRM